jgi:hypothetical protein
VRIVPAEREKEGNMLLLVDVISLAGTSSNIAFKLAACLF